jgi:hypothetical protein
MWPCIMTNFLVKKQKKCTNFSNLFWNETLHISDSSSVHHQELFTVHTATLYVIQDCRQLLGRIRMETVPPWSCCCSKTVCVTYTIAECTVNNSWWWTEELSEICRVSFQNKFEKLVHLVGDITKKYRIMSSTRPRLFLSTSFPIHFGHHSIITQAAKRSINKQTNTYIHTQWEDKEYYTEF